MSRPGRPGALRPAALDKLAVARGEYWRLWTRHPAPRQPAPPAVQHVRAVAGRSDRRALVRLASGSCGFYLACAAAGSAASFVFGGDVPSVGASGAIFGLFGILLAAGRLHHPVDRQSRALVGQLGMLIAINLVFGFASGGAIDNRRPHRRAGRGPVAGRAHPPDRRPDAVVALAAAVARPRHPGRSARWSAGRAGFMTVVALGVVAIVVAAGCRDRHGRSARSARSLGPGSSGSSRRHGRRPSSDARRRRGILGSTTLTRAPRGATFSACAVPPWAAASSRTIARPKPAARSGSRRIGPEEPLERARSAAPGGKPGPSSVTARITARGPRRRRRPRRRRSARRRQPDMPARRRAPPQARCRPGWRGSAPRPRDRRRTGAARDAPTAAPWASSRGGFDDDGELDPGGGRGRPEPLDRAGEAGRPRRWARVAGPAAPRRRPLDRPELVDEPLEAGGLLADRPGGPLRLVARRRAVRERGRVAADHRERRPEVVAQVGQQGGLAGPRRLELLGHGVESRGQLAHLGRVPRGAAGGGARPAAGRRLPPPAGEGARPPTGPGAGPGAGRRRRS